MKNMKKFFSLVLAIVMVMALAAPVMAAEDDYYTITITNADEVNGVGHTYEAYQIFSGDFHEYVLSNIKWGTAIDGDGYDNSEELLEALKADTMIGTYFTSCTSAAEVAAVLTGSNFTNDGAHTNRFAQIVEKYLEYTPDVCKSDAGVVTGGQVVYTIEIPKAMAGYYLIKDQDNSQDNGTGTDYTKFMLRVVGDVSVEHKSSIPSVRKEVSNSTSEYTDEITAAMNRDYYYRLIGTLPSEYDYYDEYYYEFEDTMSAGIDYVGIERVYVYHPDNGGTRIDINESQYTVNATAASDGKTVLSVKFNDLKQGLQYTDEENQVHTLTLNNRHQIVVVYKAKLNNDAVIAQGGNKNSVTLIYSNNPNGEGHGKTTPDDTTVYTFKVNVTKKDGGDRTTTLAGAKFILYRLDAASNPEYIILDANNKVQGVTSNVNEATVVTTGTDGTLQITGLRASTYYLKEIEAPAGYNLPDNTVSEFTIGYKTDDSGVVNTLTVAIQNAYEAGSVVEDGVVSFAVYNYKGSILPTTGGMGTTLFYVFGSIMVVGAAVLLITKKRMAA